MMAMLCSLVKRDFRIAVFPSCPAAVGDCQLTSGSVGRATRRRSSANLRAMITGFGRFADSLSDSSFVAPRESLVDRVPIGVPEARASAR